MIERLRGNSLSASAASARGGIGEETNDPLRLAAFAVGI